MGSSNSESRGPYEYCKHCHNRRSAGSWAWAGLANTYFWIDPTSRVAGLILTQILPFCDRAVLALFDRFERSVYGRG